MAVSDLCREPWLLRPDVARKVAQLLERMERETGLGWSILSGYRTPEVQAQLEREGRPTAPVECSTHLTCPATGADIRFHSFPTRTIKARFGLAATELGLRWGGGSPPDEAGIPADWNHVDNGPIC